MNDVIFYSNNCPRCNVLKKKLVAKNISYIECNDVEKMLEIGIDVTPMLSVNGKLLDFKTACNWVDKQGG